MGLGASVVCNCYKEGRTPPPPFPGWMIYADAGGELSLDLPWEENKDKHNLFCKWKEHACEHEDMNYAYVDVSGWSSYYAFKQALEQVGCIHLPVLRVELQPQISGRFTSAKSAVKALQELDYFQHHADLGTNVFLVNSTTGKVLQAYNEMYEGLLIRSQDGMNVGFDPKGFFIVTKSPPQEHFRAMRFEQRLLEPKSIKALKEKSFEFVDLETEHRFICPINKIVHNEFNFSLALGYFMPEPYPRFMHVEKLKVDASEFEDILDSLTQIFQAAVETSNPIRWN